MADEKLNTGPAENISPEAAEPITTPEQAAASEPQQEQTGPAIPEPGDVVVSFDKINELMISGMEVKEDDEDFMNAVDYMFAGLEKRKPDCFAVKQYKKYKLASGVT